MQDSESKKLVQEIKKKKLVEEEESESEDEDDGMTKTGKEEKKAEKKETVNDRYLVTCSLICRLFMHCSSILASEFAVNTFAHLAKKTDPHVETLIKSVLNHLRTKDLEDQAIVSYWRFVDLVLVKLHSDNEGRKACELAKIVSKIFYDGFDRATQQKKSIIQEKYLKFVINTLLYAISAPTKYDFLSVDIVLANKAYLDPATYKKIIAFFEVLISLYI